MRWSHSVAPLALALAAACGQSELSKAYDAYNPVADRMLEAEAPKWKRLVALLNEQREDASGLERFAEFVNADARPFYARFQSDVDALLPGDPALEPAHAKLRTYAAKRREFAETLGANLGVLAPTAAEEELDRKSRAADLAKQRYGEAIRGDTYVADHRAGALNTLAQTFQRDVMQAFADGRVGAADVEQKVRAQILPEVRRLRNDRYEDDEPSRLLRQAVVAAEEFYACVADKFPEIERRSNGLVAAKRLADDGDSALKEFREALAEVRRRK